MPGDDPLRRRTHVPDRLDRAIDDQGQGDIAALTPLLRGHWYTEEARLLDEFNQRFAAYQLLDHDILELAMENTNLKAQRLSFGPGRDAADAFKAALTGLTSATSPGGGARVDPLVARAVLAVREIQVLQAPHIAEPEDAAMTRMEEQMSALWTTARGALLALSDLDLVAPTDRERLTGATAALDKFKEVHTKIVALSRRNSNVRSLALTTGRKRALAAACEVSLAALEAALSKEGSKATR